MSCAPFCLVSVNNFPHILSSFQLFMVGRLFHFQLMHHSQKQKFLFLWTSWMFSPRHEGILWDQLCWERSSWGRERRGSKGICSALDGTGWDCTQHHGWAGVWEIGGLWPLFFPGAFPQSSFTLRGYESRTACTFKLFLESHFPGCKILYLLFMSGIFFLLWI